MLRFCLFSILMLFNSCFAVCPDSAAEILVINTSPYKLRLESKEEKTCKRHHIGDVQANEKEKYFCIEHNYLLKITTYYKNKRVAIAATDVWNDVIVYASDKKFDVRFKHLRGDETLTHPKGRKSIDWDFHKHDSKQHNVIKSDK